MKYSIFILLFVCILGFSGVARAQLNSLSQTDINVDMVPQNPGPNQMVSISLTSYSTNINAANITWKVNGKTQKTGVGEKLFSFKTGDMNVKTTLDISVQTIEGEVIKKTLIIEPSGVDLIWQSYGFVPPFYKGKSIFSHQNKITFIAVPHITSGSGAEIPAKNLIYKWKNNGTVIDNLSGYGKNTYTFVSSLISRPMDIEVEVSSQTAGSTGYASINVNPTEPSVIFYAKDPLYGIEFQKALRDAIRLDASKELTVLGVPFFFGTTGLSDPNLSYKWSINGSPINNGSNSGTQVFRQSEGTSGTSNISLSIESGNKILQSASGSFNLTFGEGGSQ